jgi:hypothetical protein
MQFSDTTNKSGILQRIEFTLGFPDGAITGDTTQKAHFTTLVNEAYYEVVMDILRSQDSWDFDDTNYTDMAIASTPMVALQRSYLFPPALKALKIKRVDITYDGVNYVHATPIDSLDFGDGVGNADHEDANFSTTRPAYDVLANVISVYPRATADQVTAGASIRLEFYRELDGFTTSDTTQEPGIDRPWHELIPLGASMKYASMRSMENARSLKVLFDEKMAALRTYYGRKQDDKMLALGTPYDIGDNS